MTSGAAILQQNIENAPNVVALVRWSMRTVIPHLDPGWDMEHGFETSSHSPVEVFALEKERKKESSRLSDWEDESVDKVREDVG